jgi:Cu-Zn family superoxide dismutase
MLLAAVAAVGLAPAPTLAAKVHTTLHLATASGPGAEVGSVTITDSPQGAKIILDLHGLPPGPRGLHVHQEGSCAASKGPDGALVPAGAAGPHFDPARTGRHMGPKGQGHLGDLPRVDVAPNGTARATMTAPRINAVSALRGRALVLHAGGDTYSEPPPLGGGGARLACGILK